MNIAIDISPLHSGHNGRGIGSYTQNLVSAIAAYGKDHTVIEFDRRQGIPASADVVHFPYFDPYFLTLPPVKIKPTVVTVHDLIPLVFPDKFPAGIRGRIKWQVQRLSLRGAKRILTDSYSSKKDIAQITGVQPSIIDVVYLAADPVYHPVTLSTVSRKKLALPGQYILYVGDVNWNKNIPGLVRAFAEIRKHREFSQYKLVLVGRAIADEELSETRVINQLIHECDLESNIVRTGALSQKDLVGLYSLASTYIQPSYYEGFGLPVLEAMSCGCPVVCTNVSSLKEIAGPSLVVDPTPESIASGLMRMLQTDRQQQIRKQYEWVKKFTWEQVAKETLASYERALA